MPDDYTLPEQAAQDFAEHGVALLRQAIAPRWVDKLRVGMEKHLANPTARQRVWARDERGPICIYDNQAWRQIAEYREFVEQSPIAEIAARTMGAERINFFYDAIFVRVRDAQFRTPFHQDEPYWSVRGFNTCSIWMPLVAVEKQSALELVRGSHRWQQNFHQKDFSELTQDERDRHAAADATRAAFPDIDGDRDRYDIVSWAMEPGDCVAFNARTIHGGSGRLARGRELKVFNTQWLGDDVRVCFRPEGMDPDHSQVMTEWGLKPGDRIGTELYPEFRFAFD